MRTKGDVFPNHLENGISELCLTLAVKTCSYIVLSFNTTNNSWNHFYFQNTFKSYLQFVSLHLQHY